MCVRKKDVFPSDIRQQHLPGSHAVEFYFSECMCLDLARGLLTFPQCSRITHTLYSHAHPFSHPWAFPHTLSAVWLRLEAGRLSSDPGEACGMSLGKVGGAAPGGPGAGGRNWSFLFF